MVMQLQTDHKSLYDTDYNLWVLETVKKLEKKDLDSLDWENLIEEVLDLSKRDKRKIESLLMRLIEHLLKLQYWDEEKDRNKGHWQGEIRNFRKQIKRLLKDSPSLKPYLEEILGEFYQDAREIVSDRSQLPLNIFPETPMATLEKILDENWLP
ncbi:DUF29 domain-containing protein [Cyanobacterium stanieri LEGE 03274]|uniref:DUF29 domain-containing protein n=1 Tax=Cyanobacterium stanieri LEGE 03274 TaxID=1828756 RepID=A0ABR9V6Y2_9CHRO|nr:DUF29 domain-containing protein [Cyanobacterium stanieri]MBE9223649.1 DUF29 domain-containing protein [Cyanobacterium stanieri LEGE 03274]